MTKFAANILAVDTSSKLLSVALRSKRGKKWEANLGGTPSHSEQLIHLVQTGLKRLKIKKEELDVLLWGMGPGSFTGLRIGFSVLKGFTLGLKKKAFGASSLDLIALGAGIGGDLAVCVDARRQRIYTAIYTFKTDGVKKVLRDCVLSFDELMNQLKPGMAVAGDALAAYGPLIREKKGKEVTFLNQDFWYPRAIFLIDLYESKRDWLIPLSLKNMKPQYLRVSEAEEKAKASRQKLTT